MVLSACQTELGSGALADVSAGDDWVGLTRAFLHAGAARVVATLWPAERSAKRAGDVYCVLLFVVLASSPAPPRPHAARTVARAGERG